MSRLGAGGWMSQPPAPGMENALLLLLAIDGSCHVEAGAARTSIPAGSFCVLSRQDEISLIRVEGEVAVVGIPGQLAGSWYYAVPRQRPIVIDAGEGIPSVVAHLVDTLTSAGGRAAESPTRLVPHLVGLIALTCLGAVADEGGAANSTLLQQAMGYIDQNLGESGLSPDRIADAICVSTRTLHRLFEKEGLTVSGWIRRRRLENCRKELAEPRLSGQSVSAIGARWGLCDAAHFSRLFKATYGISPRAFRLSQLGRENR